MHEPTPDTESYPYPVIQQDAAILVPLVLELITPPSRVVDVGGGTGAWCLAFKEAGIEQVRCIDHPSVPEAERLVGASEFVACDLNEAFPDPFESDLAVCTELAEHLDSKRHGPLVDYLCQCSDLVLFSAAIPGQPDPRHISARPLSYWRGLFEERGYTPFDLLRPRIIDNLSVSYWYRQNLLLYANAAGAARLKTQDASFREIPADFELVHQTVLDTYRTPSAPQKLGAALAALGGALKRSLLYRANRRP